MNPYITAQTTALLEGLRLLEAYVTAPLGLYSDIRMMRESLPFPESEELTREELSQRRQAHAALTDDYPTLALRAILAVRTTIDALVDCRDDGAAVLNESWLRRSRIVLTRAEQRMGASVRAEMVAKLKGVYVIVDPEATRGRDPVTVARDTLEGGARVVQLRNKQNDKKQVLDQARRIKSLCQEHDVLFFVNDDADVALTAGAHGLHVGQTDLPTEDARRVLEPGQLIGRSNGNLPEALASQAQEVDYIAVGPIYATTTMGKSGRSALGPEMVRLVKNAVPQPIVAIGGINAENLSEVVRAGADCVCVVSAITYTDDPVEATRQLVNLFEE
ncbi:thiamine phosphate synthase [Dehalococcoidia bacterium]|nr:thiamine phosphate synthase [Dehalococcoidia bacterium]